MRGLMVFLAVAMAGTAQVTAVYSPEPMAVTRTVGVETIGLWAVRMCNESAAAVTVPEERVYMAAPQLRLIGADRAAQVLTTTVSRHWTGKVLRALGYAALGAAVIGMAKGVDPEVAAWISFGGATLPRVADQVRGEQPATAVFTDGLLRGAVPLGPGGCATRLVFAARQAKVESFSAVIR